MNQTTSINRFLTLPTLVGGGVVLATALLTRMTVGNPLLILHKLGAMEMLPPLWFLSLICVVLNFHTSKPCHFKIVLCNL